MKKFSTLLCLALLLLTGCNASKLTIEVEQPPIYVDGTPSEIVLSITKDGEAVSGLSVKVDLEMAKMDHGHIQVEMTEVGDGRYAGEVELPMGGEWLADVKAESDDNKAEDLITFEVEER